MTFAPERITVKRRRDEEPVDALYFPPQKSRRTVVWNRVSINSPCDDTLSRTVHPTTRKDLLRIPNVRTTLPEEDDVTGSLNGCARLQHNATENTGSCDGHVQGVEEPVNPLPANQDRFPFRLSEEPRKFHLTRSSTSTTIPSVLHGGIRKSRRKQKKNLALFVERTNSVQKLSHCRTNRANIKDGLSISSANVPKPPADTSSPRKRPLASLAEQNWRARNWNQSMDGNSKTNRCVADTKENDTKSLQLARQLQQFALNASRTNHETGHVDGHLFGKVKPKPPKPRPAKAGVSENEEHQNISADPMDLSCIKEDPEDYVIDVYVRQAEHVGEHVLHGMREPLERTSQKVGVLVIEDEDQEAWELYGDDNQSSDEDWNSEEEDENAEDYYGNDYPEDELDSDDEYDKDTYKHWHGAFDDEEFEDNIDWSDDKLTGEQRFGYHQAALR